MLLGCESGVPLRVILIWRPPVPRPKNDCMMQRIEWERERVSMNSHKHKRYPKCISISVGWDLTVKQWRQKASWLANDSMRSLTMILSLFSWRLTMTTVTIGAMRQAMKQSFSEWNGNTKISTQNDHLLSKIQIFMPIYRTLLPTRQLHLIIIYLQHQYQLLCDAVWTIFFFSTATMSDNNDNASVIMKELEEFCCKSDSLSEEGLREIFELHGLTSKNNLVDRSNFFFMACHMKVSTREQFDAF